MNKGELIDAVASDLNVTKAAATETVNAVIECITRGINKDQSVNISGFGTFEKRQRAARTGRNPATGQPMEIKASTTVGFRPSSQLKETV
jgi:nucleoid DNA-binding protein